jgi:hypothetical protein
MVGRGWQRRNIATSGLGHASQGGHVVMLHERLRGTSRWEEVGYTTYPTGS